MERVRGQGPAQAAEAEDLLVRVGAGVREHLLVRVGVGVRVGARFRSGQGMERVGSGYGPRVQGPGQDQGQVSSHLEQGWVSARIGSGPGPVRAKVRVRVVARFMFRVRVRVRVRVGELAPRAHACLH
eukprot:scaffold40829_cov52-Phaeocystis_antarctica.AAC.1